MSFEFLVSSFELRTPLRATGWALRRGRPAGDLRPPVPAEAGGRGRVGGNGRSRGAGGRRPGRAGRLQGLGRPGYLERSGWRARLQGLPGSTQAGFGSLSVPTIYLALPFTR